MLTDWGREDTDGDAGEGVHNIIKAPGQSDHQRGEGFSELELVIEKGGNSLEMGFATVLPVVIGEVAMVLEYIKTRALITATHRSPGPR